MNCVGSTPRNKRAPGRGRRALLAGLCLAALGGCQARYRVGERVLVTVGEGERAAYVVSVEGPARYRVRFEGVGDGRETAVTADRIAGRAPAPGSGLARDEPARAEDFAVGDRLRVTWGGSPCAATVLALEPGGRLLVRYDGLETDWDESIPLERVLGRR